MGDLLKKIISLLFKILLIVFGIYLLKYLFEYLSWNFTLDQLFYYVIVGFGLWILAEWMKG